MSRTMLDIGCWLECSECLPLGLWFGVFGKNELFSKFIFEKFARLCRLLYLCCVVTRRRHLTVNKGGTHITLPW